ncbi:Dethiobiotin synthetase [Phormidesmis sp. 146-35]
MSVAIVDYDSARRLLLDQSRFGVADTFLGRLQRSHPPMPGQVTSILLALKVVFEALKEEGAIDRDLAYALHLVSSEGRQLFEVGLRKSSDCPPLLNEDLTRIALAVKSIFSGVWQG